MAGAADEAAESGQEAIRLLEIGSLSRATGKTEDSFARGTGQRFRHGASATARLLTCIQLVIALPASVTFICHLT